MSLTVQFIRVLKLTDSTGQKMCSFYSSFWSAETDSENNNVDVSITK